ncbi:MAG: NFACT family protein [Treponema sp.]|nr:NFACT family protein [Treponema sp.]
MSLNCNEINKILSELDLNGSFIQEIIQPGFDTLCFRIINKGSLENLLICTSPQATRLNLTKYKPPKNEKPLRFNQFLKSRVQGMRINSIVQLGLDRIIKMDISTWKEKLYVYVRLWSNAANVIVTDEGGTILDCMFRRPKKGEVTGGTFTPEEKNVTEEEQKASLEKFPVRDFSDMELTEEQKNFTFNQKIDLYYSEHAKVLSRESLLEQAEKWYNVRHSKMEAALEKLEQKKKGFENSASLKHTGDLILSFGSQVEGSTLTCIDYETQKEVHIRIDPKKSVQENAAIYYEQYKKAASGLDALEHDIELSKKAIADLEKEYADILNQKNVLKIEQMLRHDTKPKQQTEKATPGLRYEIEGWTLYVGRTATENDDLLRHYVKGQDMWLHTRDYAGGYVFIKGKKDKTVPLEILLYAGNLAVYHSKARKNGQADLYYTQVKHLRRAKDGPKGLVLPTQEKNLFIKIDDTRMRKLDEYLVQ